MKRILYIIPLLLAGLFFNACQEDLPELGEKPSVGSLNYQITQNPEDPNMVILQSQTPDVIPLWSHPMGRSTKVQDTVRLAFPGDYKFVYSVQSSAGFVSADTFELEITTTNLSYVSDPLWDNLTGGVGESKTWLLDLDENGVSKYWDGPMYFYGTNNGWQGECLVEGGDCWNWSPAWEGNQWIAAAGDYGSMTFSLEGNAQLTANHLMVPSRGEETGTYFLDVNNHTLSTTDATPLHSQEYEDCVESWTSARVFSLGEDHMQLAFLRKESCDGAALLVYNYISQEYAENWVPEDLPDPEPPYDGDANDDLTTNVTTTKTWAVNLDYPYNWHDLGGNPLNEVATYGSDPEGFAFTTWAPPYDEAIFSNISMEMTKTGDNEGEYVVVTGAEETIEGTYTIDENNNINFGQQIQFFSGVGGWLTFGTTAENTLRILDAETDGSGNVTGLWLGQKATDKDEYLSIHLSVVTGGSEEPEEPEGTELAFDNSKLDLGDLEGNGNLRIELYNDFGTTKADPPLDPTAVVFGNRVEITFTLQGVTLVDGAAGSYNTAVGLADADWSAQFWGDGTGAGSVTVNGDGTYTVYADPGSDFETALVFVVDILGMAADIEDLAAVTATIDSVVIY